MRAGTHHTEETKLELRRAQGRAWHKNRDYVLLREEQKAARAKLPPRELPAMRLCLGCRILFRSKSCGNRRCNNCKDGSIDTAVECGLFGDALFIDEMVA